jgi:uncharacterized DUF497 family protein
MKYEWDEKKNTKNVEKHGIDFADALPIFFRGRRCSKGLW